MIWPKGGGMAESGMPSSESPLREALEEHGCEIADVALLRGAAFLALRRFADAVAAQFDYAADGKDIARLDVLVNEAVGVQHIERCDQAGCELRHIRDGEMALVEDLGEIRVHLLKDRIDDGAAIELGLAEVLELEEVRMAATPRRNANGQESPPRRSGTR